PQGETRFRFFDGVEHEGLFYAHDDGVFEGEIADVPGSYVVLAHVDDAVAGTLFVPGVGVYRVRPRGGGERRVTEIDLAKVPPETLPLIPPTPADLGVRTAAALTGAATVAADSTATTVDLMVVYTPAAASANGGASGIAALINAAVATANRSYVNSG